jgi:ketosteroid isomerase-like protein
MSIEKNVQVVKDFFAAMASGYKQGLLSLSAEDIEWIVPSKDWPQARTAGTRDWRRCCRRLPQS